MSNAHLPTIIHCIAFPYKRMSICVDRPLSILHSTKKSNKLSLNQRQIKKAIMRSTSIPFLWFILLSVLCFNAIDECQGQQANSTEAAAATTAAAVVVANVNSTEAAAATAAVVVANVSAGNGTTLSPSKARIAEAKKKSDKRREQLKELAKLKGTERQEMVKKMAKERKDEADALVAERKRKQKERLDNLKATSTEATTTAVVVANVNSAGDGTTLSPSKARIAEAKKKSDKRRQQLKELAKLTGTERQEMVKKMAKERKDEADALVAERKRKQKERLDNLKVKQQEREAKSKKATKTATTEGPSE